MEDEAIKQINSPAFTFISLFQNNTHFERQNNAHACVTSPEGSRRLGIPDFLNIRHIKVVRLSALCIGCLKPRPQEIPLTLNLSEDELTTGS